MRWFNVNFLLGLEILGKISSMSIDNQKNTIHYFYVLSLWDPILLLWLISTFLVIYGKLPGVWLEEIIEFLDHSPKPITLEFLDDIVNANLYNELDES